MMANPSYADTCPYCQGSGEDPGKRRRQCPECYGSGSVSFCERCRRQEPCGGIQSNIFDGWCERTGPEDERTGDEIAKGRLCQ